MTVRLDGKIALVTGASAGVGRAIATILIERGAHVVGTGRGEAAGIELEKELRAGGGDFTFVRADASQCADCEAAVAACISKHGRIDILINNVGNSVPIRAVENISDDDWDAVVKPTLDSVRWTTRAALPQMKAQHDGVIINIASLAGVQALANLGAYGAAKAGVIQLTRSTAVENFRSGVRANVIILGIVETGQAATTGLEMGREVIGKDFMPDATTSLGALGVGVMKPDQVGRAVAVLCSDDAREINGSTISVDRTFSAGYLATGMFFLGLAGKLPDLPQSG